MFKPAFGEKWTDANARFALPDQPAPQQPVHTYRMPAIELTVHISSCAEPLVKGRLDHGFVTVLASFSRTSVTVPVQEGTAAIPPTLFTVHDSGAVKATLIFKLGVLGEKPLRSDECVGEQEVFNATRPVVYMANVEWPLEALNGELQQTAVGAENRKFQFSVTGKAHAAVPLPAEFFSGNRTSLEEARMRLNTMRCMRAGKLHSTIARVCGEQRADECMQYVPMCAQDSFVGLPHCDIEQLHALRDAVATVHRDTYMMYLLPAAQLVLGAEAARNANSIDRAGLLVAAADRLSADRKELMKRLFDATRRVATSRSTYAYDAGLGGLLMQPGTHECLMTPATTPRGESQNTGGLVAAGTRAVRGQALAQIQQRHAREACAAKAIATRAGQPTSQIERREAALQNLAHVMQFEGFLVGDCEDMSTLIENTVRSLTKYAQPIDLRRVADRVLAQLLPHDTASHQALKTLLCGAHVAALEAERKDNLCGMALVLARSAKMGQEQGLVSHAQDVYQPGAHVSAQNVYDTLLEESAESGGHAVFTAYSVTDSTEVSPGVFACRVRPDFTTYEGTADVQTRPHLGNTREPVAFDKSCVPSHYLALESSGMNACVARNIKNAYMADRATYTVHTHPAFANVGLASELHFFAAQCSDPCDKDTSFYRFAMSLGPHAIISCDGDVEEFGRAVAAGAAQMGAVAGVDTDEARLAPAASMVLAQNAAATGPKIIGELATAGSSPEIIGEQAGSSPEIIGLRIPASEEEKKLIGVFAEATQGLFPSLDQLLQSAQQTNFYLLPTSTRPEPAGARVHCLMPAAPLAAGWEVEMAAREHVSALLGASGWSGNTSHSFTLHFPEK